MSKPDLGSEKHLAAVKGPCVVVKIKSFIIIIIFIIRVRIRIRKGPGSGQRSKCDGQRQIQKKGGRRPQLPKRGEGVHSTCEHQHEPGDCKKNDVK